MAEFLALSIAVDTGDLRVTGGLAAWFGDWGPLGARIVLLGVILSVVFGAAMSRLSQIHFRHQWIAGRALLFHLCVAPVFAASAILLFRPQTQAPAADILTLACMLFGSATILSGLCILLPAGFWLDLWRGARWAPVYAFSLAASAFWLISVSRWIWKPWMNFTFSAVHGFLGFIRPDVVADPSNYTIGTRAFAVMVAAPCSGYEGVALMLLFGTAWLCVFRREFRFPQSLLLVPAGMVAMWGLNVVRISALILIGSAGAPAVALGGFHSQAGWIAFLCLSLAFMTASQRVAWFAAEPDTQAAAAAQEDTATAAFLVPFLTILAAGFLSSAVKGTFEWAYGLRVLGGGAAILYFRRRYSGVSWRVGWESVAAGIAVFGIWIAGDRLLLPHASRVAMPAALAASSATLRITWLALRVIGATVTVPIAEELAFRGYLLRRLSAREFSQVDLREFHFVPFVVSSILFGMLHGQRWIAGMIAGLVYAAVARRRGSLGDSVLAHATTNAAIAVLVLTSGNWNLW